ncbi:uncharacterized protein LOC123526283 [Mercenaria mercenaria]|uniref:uncharacterized protein LOC123526283 n=1 Tax=Mercenaria mercenaria TaxID=6596 RepID=UPI00234EA1A9|nr:uncharacterized protein LOC123526283 [Mercenaria mercenaria]
MEIKWKKRLSYITLGLFYFIGGVEYAVILPTLWLYLKTDFGAQEYMLGLLLSAYSFAAIISGPVLGRWSDRTRKPKIILAVGTVFQVVGNIMYFMGISVWFLLASRLVAGIGGGAEAVIMSEVTRSTEESKRTGIISILVAIRQTGLLVGPGLNLFLRKMNFYVDGFHVNKYNVPGAFMACVWTIQIFILAFLYSDLDKLVKKEKSTGSQSQGQTARPLEDQYSSAYRTDYDEDIYKELGADTCDRKSINSNASSKSPFNDPDDLMETAEDFMTDSRRRFRSLTPSGIGSSKNALNGVIGQRSASANGVVAMETDYGTFEGSLTTPVDENRCHLGSQEYINSTEDGLVDYLEGKSKLKFIYHEYVREEIVAVIAVQFNSYFNQLALETMVTPLTLKLFNWGELENSIFYCIAGCEVIIVFGLVTWVSKRLEDRVLLVIGTLTLAAANSWLIYVIPVAFHGTYDENLWKFIIGSALDLFALPFLVSSSISLYSKITRKETQGLSMGLRRSVVGLATILAPLWASSTLTMPYLMFGAMLGLLGISLVMLVISYSKLRPISEMPVNRAGLITSSESDSDIATRPLLS